MEFENFHLENSVGCMDDYLLIREHNETGDVIGRFCGAGLPPPLISTVPLWIMFHSDQKMETQGFRISYQVEREWRGAIVIFIVNNQNNSNLTHEKTSPIYHIMGIISIAQFNLMVAIIFCCNFIFATVRLSLSDPVWIPESRYYLV